MRLAVVIPSRGLVHSRTVAAVLRETAPHEARIFWAHGRPIPECFNGPVAEAIAWEPEKVWIVEEDMHLPVGILAELIAADAPVAAADYPVTADGHMCVAWEDGKARHTGTGCLLADPDVLAAHPFTADWQFMLPGWRRVPVGPNEKAHQYGGHDIEFGMALYEAGTPIHVIGRTCGQYRIRRHAREHSNDGGAHDVEVWQ